MEKNDAQKEKIKKSQYGNGKIRLARSSDNMETLSKLYVIGGEKILPWIYGKQFEDMYIDAVKTNFILESTYVFEIDNKIVGLISAYPHDYNKKSNPNGFHKELKKHLKGLDWFLFLNRCGKFKKYLKEPPNSYHVAIIAVFDEYRKKGIAGKLLSYVEDIAKKQGYESIFAEVQNENIPSIKTFEEQGYATEYSVPTTKLSKKYWKDKNLTILFMKKKLI